MSDYVRILLVGYASTLHANMSILIGSCSSKAMACHSQAGTLVYSSNALFEPTTHQCLYRAKNRADGPMNQIRAANALRCRALCGTIFTIFASLRQRTMPSAVEFDADTSQGRRLMLLDRVAPAFKQWHC